MRKTVQKSLRRHIKSCAEFEAALVAPSLFNWIQTFKSCFLTTTSLFLIMYVFPPHFRLFFGYLGIFNQGESSASSFLLFASSYPSVSGGIERYFRRLRWEPHSHE